MKPFGLFPARGPAFSRTAAAGVWCVLLLHSLARAAGDEAPVPVPRRVDSALNALLLVAAGLGVLILAAIAVFVLRRVFSAPAVETPAVTDPLLAAAAEQKRGNFGAAAACYEAGGDLERAAESWERAKELTRAAECWEKTGDLERAAAAHVRSGSALRAAGIYMQSKNYMEAAKIFRNKGDHLRAAQSLELYGNRLAAAREYAAGGDPLRAARLLAQEKLYDEAAESFQQALGGAEVTAAGADDHCAYAALLARAGKRDQAAAIFGRVLAVLPHHVRARSGLQSLQSAAPAPAPAPAVPVPVRSPDDAPLKRVFTLRSMIRAGRMEPRYGMRLWVQVMRALAERHRAGAVLGSLTPDSIFIDMENNVRLDAADRGRPEYVAPEVLAGRPPDRRADIYSMGVILYELAGGTLEHFGKKRAGELYSDVPRWLDELVVCCTALDPAKRYQSAEEVSAAILKLKNATQE